MSDYRFIDPLAGFGPATVTHSAPQHPLGYEAKAIDANAVSSGGAGGVAKFVYCRGASASTVASAGQWVHIQNGSAMLLAAANSASALPVGIAAAALSTTNVYGWVQVEGRVDYAQHTNTGLTAGIPQYIAAGTPGLVLSNAVAGNRVQGIYVPFNQTVTATSVSFVYDIQRPFVAGLTAGL